MGTITIKGRLGEVPLVVPGLFMNSWRFRTIMGAVDDGGALLVRAFALGTLMGVAAVETRVGSRVGL